MRAYGKVASLLMGLLLALVGTAVVAQPASAASRDCASGYFCFWVDANYSGPRYNLGSSGRNGNLQGNPCGGCRSGTNSGANGTWNDMASSWYNRTSVPVCIYTNANYTGLSKKIEKGSYLSYYASWNDQMSSVRPAIKHGGGGTIPTSYSCF